MSESSKKVGDSHTPEPWIVNGGSFGHSYLAAWGDRIGKIQPARGHDADENARRIVACVNACAGLDTEGLENMLSTGESLLSMNDKTVSGYLATAGELNRLQARCDQLLAALENTLSAYVAMIDSGDTVIWDSNTDEDVISARAVIAAVKGGA